MDARVRKPSTHPMPEIADFVRSLRDAFGDDVIDEAVRGGKSGEPSFYACENGRSAGTAAPSGPADFGSDATASLLPFHSSRQRRHRRRPEGRVRLRPTESALL